LDKTTLNAVVTLRNEISPWLMILQVAPDGWNLPDYAPGQFAILGLFGSASRCGSPHMSESMITLLAQEGFKEDKKTEPGQVHVEKYWQ
jgi:NAD(P)H-flavin reductase